MRAATEFLLRSNPMSFGQKAGGHQIGTHYSLCGMLAAVLKPSSLAEEPRVCGWAGSGLLADWHKAARIVFKDMLRWTTKAESHY